MIEGEQPIPEDAKKFTGQENSEILAERQKHWEHVEVEVDGIQDRLGKKVESGIRETVIGLKAHELSTTGSCEGHEDWGLPFPWVDIESPETTRMKKDPKFRVLSKKATAARQGGEPMTRDEAAEYHEMLVQQRIANDVARQRIVGLLSEFYGQDAESESPMRISFADVPRIRMQPLYGRAYDAERHALLKQGMTQQDVVKVLKTKYVQNLLGGQGEMRRFAEFLKEKFLAEK